MRRNSTCGKHVIYGMNEEEERIPLLQCGVIGCQAPSIDPHKQSYYVLGAGKVVNCRACGEQRGWGGLRDRVIRDAIQRRQPASNDAAVSTATGIMVEDQDQEPATTTMTNNEEDVQERLVHLNVTDFLHTLATTSEQELQSSSPGGLRHHLRSIVEALLQAKSLHGVTEPLVVMGWLHDLCRLWPWWLKLADHSPTKSSRWWWWWSDLYQCRVADYLSCVRQDLLRQRDICPCCRRSYEACIERVLEASPSEIISKESVEACRDVQSLHVRMLQMGAIAFASKS